MSEQGEGCAKFCPLCRWACKTDMARRRAAPCRGTTEAATPMETLMRIVKLFNGHLHGECVATSSALIAPHSPEISERTFCRIVECTIPSAFIRSFIKLSQEMLCPMGETVTEAFGAIALSRVHGQFPVTVLPFPKVSPCLLGMRVLEVLPAGLTVLVAPHTTTLMTAPVLSLASTTCIFDLQLLSQSADKIYVRTKSGPRDLGTIDVSGQMRRAILRQTSLLPIACNVLHSLSQSTFMRHAADMIANREWHMDDEYIGRRGWVVARWGVMAQYPSSVRRTETRAANPPTFHKECPICLSDFAPADIVVNLPCNHNVHTVCDHSTSSGMCQWLSKGNNPSCPTCRASIVSAFG